MKTRLYKLSEVSPVPKPSIFNFIDIEGLKFNKLRVIAYAGAETKRKKSLSRWYCQCECGNIKIIIGSQLKNGKTKSCGCFKPKKRNLPIHKKMGRYSTNSPENISYHSAKRRCTNPNVHNYKEYGGRGIEFRFKSFEEFYDHIGKRPTPQHSLDRIDVDGHYEKGNVRWATKREQVINRRNSKKITAFGKTLSIAEWSTETGFKFDLIWYRITKLDWCAECALTIPPIRPVCGHK